MKNQTLAEQRRQLQKTAGLLNETFLGFGNFHKINELGMTAMGEDDEAAEDKWYGAMNQQMDQESADVKAFKGPQGVTITFKDSTQVFIPNEKLQDRKKGQPFYVKNSNSNKYYGSFNVSGALDGIGA